MFTSVKIFGVALCLSVLTGCMSNAQGPRYSKSKATQHKPGHATLYILREHAEPTFWGATIYIDGKEVVTLKQHGFTWAYVKPGYRYITAVWPLLSGQREAFFSLNVVEGKTYYLELEGISRLDIGLFGDRVIMDSNLSCPEAREARLKLIMSCKFQKPAQDSF